MQWFSGSPLKSKDSQQRVQAIGKLANARDRQSKTALMTALGDPEATVRMEALKVITLWRDEDTLRALTFALKDSAATIRERAIGELQGLGARDSIADLLPVLCDSAAPVRAAAANALAALGWRAETAGERALEYIGRSQFGKAATIGRAALELILPFAENTVASTRQEVAEALGLIRDPQASEALQKLTADADASVRIAAILSLTRVQPSVVALSKMLSDADKNVRMVVVEALGQLRDSEAVPLLSNCLRDASWEVRGAAAGALALMGERSTVPLLIEALKDPDADVRMAVAEALGVIGDVEAIEPLILAQLDSETPVRQTALKAIMRVDYRWYRNARAYRMLPVLKRAVRGEDYSIRAAATELLERIFSIKRHALRNVSADPEADRRIQAAEVLITCLWDDDPLLAGAAAEALGQLRSRRAIDVLKVKSEDKHPWVSQQAAQALVLIEGQGAQAGGWRHSGQANS